jgi:xanthine dehydrogenase accessory factor
MNSQSWNTASYQLSQQGKAYVIITLIGVTGSTPRNSGTKMVVAYDECFDLKSYDTIGGGHLEHIAIKYAHNMLCDGEKSHENAQHIEHFQLGSNLGQCCGGTATVLFESFIATGVNIMLFGAGHVGQALMPMLSALPCHITWVDSRASQFPDNTEQYNHTNIVVSESPEDEVAAMPENSYFIVMTHNHQMDFDISQAILKRNDFTYLGLIASDTKWRRFQQRYKHRDIDPAAVARMHCPIGLPDVQGKLPMEVAVSVAGQIISIYQTENIAQKPQQKGSQQGIALNQVKHLLDNEHTNKTTSQIKESAAVDD